MFSLFRFNNQDFNRRLRDLEKMQDAFNPFFSGFELAFNSSLDFPKKEDPNFAYSEEKVESKESTTIKETWAAIDGSGSFSRTTIQPKEKKETESDLAQKIKSAVEAEDYELAAKLKKQLEKVKKRA